MEKRLLKIVYLTLHDGQEDWRYIRLTQYMANMKMEKKIEDIFSTHGGLLLWIRELRIDNMMTKNIEQIIKDIISSLGNITDRAFSTARRKASASLH